MWNSTDQWLWLFYGKKKWISTSVKARSANFQQIDDQKQGRKESTIQIVETLMCCWFLLSKRVFLWKVFHHVFLFLKGGKDKLFGQKESFREKHKMKRERFVHHEYRCNLEDDSLPLFKCFSGKDGICQLIQSWVIGLG